MKFAELVSFTKEFNKKSSETLIMMPFYLEYGYLSDHLDALSRQTFQDFDVVVILNKVSDEKKVYGIIEEKKPAFGVIVTKRKEDTGSAGGFFTGQKYALENGYKQMIFADIDCMPVSLNLVEKLVSNKDREYVKPGGRIIENNQVTQIIPESVIPWYALLSTDLVRRCGLYYLPLYYGAEDVEYGSRIKTKPYIINSQCQHPPPSIMSYKNLEKSLVYQVNGLVIARDIGVRTLVMYLITLFVSMPAHLIFFPAYGTRAFSALLSCLLTHTYGKAAAGRMVTGFRDYITEQIPENLQHVSYSSAVSVDKRYPLMPFRIIRETFRKNVAIDYCRSGFLVTVASIFAKKAFFRIENGRYLLLSDNSNQAIHAVRLLFFAACLPFVAVFITVIILPINIILRPQTKGYGLD